MSLENGFKRIQKMRMWRPCVQTVLSRSFAVKWFIRVNVEATKNGDGAIITRKLQMHGNVRGDPCKSWSWRKGTLRKEFQCLIYQVRCTHFEGQMTESGIALCYKCQKLKLEKQSQLASGSVRVCCPEKATGLCTKRLCKVAFIALVNSSEVQLTENSSTPSSEFI